MAAKKRQSRGREILYRSIDNIAQAAVIGSPLQAELEASPEWFRARADSVDLTVVSGIGKANAKLLTDAGYDSIEAIVDSTPEDIATKTGVSNNVAANLHEAAKNHA